MTAAEVILSGKIGLLSLNQIVKRGHAWLPFPIDESDLIRQIRMHADGNFNVDSRFVLCCVKAMNRIKPEDWETMEILLQHYAIPDAMELIFPTSRVNRVKRSLRRFAVRIVKWRR